jgi:hypothetical protein
MPYSPSPVGSLRRAILEVLATSGVNHRWGWGRHYFFEALQRKVPEQLGPRQVMEILWQLVAEGLVFIDYTQPAAENWEWALSERGRRLVETEADYEPDDPEGYLEALRSKIPDLDELVLLYTHEALMAYEARCYLASTVMLGVASERAFQLLGEAFASWLPKEEAEKFRKTFDNPRNNYITKFKEFRKRIEPRKRDIPPEFSDNMALNLDSIQDLLRINRNEAGHPTGRRIDRGEAYSNLKVFAYHLAKIYALKTFFIAKASNDEAQS